MKRNFYFILVKSVKESDGKSRLSLLDTFLGMYNLYSSPLSS